MVTGSGETEVDPDCYQQHQAHLTPRSMRNRILPLNPILSIIQSFGCRLFPMLSTFVALIPNSQSSNRASSLASRVVALLLICLLSMDLPAADTFSDDTSEVELTNFAFANYLGSGFYSSGNTKLFLFRVPLSSDLTEVTREKAGLRLNYPVALGVGIIDAERDFPEIANIIDLNNFVTLSVMPGLEYVLPMTDIWSLAPFIDLGIARDFANETTVGIGGIGAKSFVNLDLDHARLTIANRLLYAEQENLDSGANTNFTSFETGLEYIVPTNYTISGSLISFSVYFINYYYLDELVLGGSVENRISLENKNEIGFTFILPKHDWLPDNSQLGFGVQVTKDTDFYRIVLGTPFF
jgi:hypothetical protein